MAVFEIEKITIPCRSGGTKKSLQPSEVLKEWTEDYFF